VEREVGKLSFDRLRMTGESGKVGRSFDRLRMTGGVERWVGPSTGSG